MRPLAVALLVVLPIFAADPPTLDQQIKTANLTDTEVKALKAHGFVVGGREYRQVFTPYIGEGPVFITSDSLLNAFHVLFEESVYRLELANARRLPTILADIEKQLPAAEKALPGDADLMKKAALRARVFLATARQLADPRGFPSGVVVRTFVEAEVKRVTAADGIEKPDWLGPPDDGFDAIDYSRCKPRGFYTRTPEMQRYFRAVSWVQAIPWRLDNDDELATFLLLAKAYQEASKPKDWAGRSFWGTFQKFLGDGDAPAVHTATDLMPNALTADGLTECRQKAREQNRGKWGTVGDQLRTKEGKPQHQFRFVSAYRLPDAVLFQRIATDKRMPSGSDVAAAVGSPFAREQLKRDAAEVLKLVDELAGLFLRPNGKDERSVYADYLDCLRVLLAESEPDAPKLFKSDAWAAKTCQTSLGSWAQMRHTWALQAKQTAMTIGVDRKYPGFVEPVPEFFARFSEVVERSEKLFDAAGAFDPTLRQTRTVGEIRAMRDAISTAQTKGLAALTSAERKALTELIPDLPATGDPAKDEKLAEVLRNAEGDLYEWMRSAMQNSGRRFADPLQDSDVATDPGLDPKLCWQDLKELCTKLEPLARKQLRGDEFSADDRRFIEGYGRQLGRVMLYDADAASFPKDDAPRVVDVHSQQSKVLEVGIGRPRVLWVVYPWKGSDVLCRGAVLPYYEFASADRLTDKDWLKLLDSNGAPEQPKWTNEWTAPKAK